MKVEDKTIHYSEIQFPCNIINVTDNERKNKVMSTLGLTWNNGDRFDEHSIKSHYLKIGSTKRVIAGHFNMSNSYKTYDYNKIDWTEKMISLGEHTICSQVVYNKTLEEFNRSYRPPLIQQLYESPYPPIDDRIYFMKVDYNYKDSNKDSIYIKKHKIKRLGGI